MTQKQEILKWIRQHGSITRATAANLHIYELSSRIGELEKDGWTFTRKTLTGTNAYGRKWRCTEYSNARKKKPAIEVPAQRNQHPWRQTWKI